MNSLDDWEMDLMVETIKKSGNLRFKALGMSMFPSILSGDVLTLESIDPNFITVGDIILFHFNQKCLVHRVIEKKEINNEIVFTTQGDHMDAPDKPIKPSHILGKVTRIERWGTSFKPDSTWFKPLNYLLNMLSSCRSLISAKLSV